MSARVTWRKSLTSSTTGSSHLVVYFWGGAGGALDYRIRNFHLPPTVQQIHKWDHVWFDPDRTQPAETGYQP